MLDLGKRESVYQPEQQGLYFPSLPSFATPADERLHRKQRLVAACRAFALHNLDYGFAGHLTIRDPESPELYSKCVSVVCGAKKKDSRTAAGVVGVVPRRLFH